MQQESRCGPAGGFCLSVAHRLPPRCHQGCSRLKVQLGNIYRPRALTWMSAGFASWLNHARQRPPPTSCHGASLRRQLTTWYFFYQSEQRRGSLSLLETNSEVTSHCFCHDILSGSQSRSGPPLTGGDFTRT